LQDFGIVGHIDEDGSSLGGKGLAKDALAALNQPAQVTIAASKKLFSNKRGRKN